MQAVKQLYVLVLGLDIIGNPFGLIRDLGTGVETLFYEPFQVGTSENNFKQISVEMPSFSIYFRVLFKDPKNSLKDWLWE